MIYKIKKMVRKLVQKLGMLAVLATASVGSGCATTPQISETYRISQDVDRCLNHPAFQNQYSREQLLFKNGRQREMILERYQEKQKIERPLKRAQKNAGYSSNPVQKAEEDADFSYTNKILWNNPYSGSIPGAGVAGALFGIVEDLDEKDLSKARHDAIRADNEALRNEVRSLRNR